MSGAGLDDIPENGSEFLMGLDMGKKHNFSFRIPLIFIILSLLFCTVAFTGTTKELNGFRKAKWGMSPEEVKANERLKLRSGWIRGGSQAPKDIYQIYHQYEELAGLSMIVAFQFFKRQFYEGNYIVESGPGPDAISEYEKLQTILINKYGPPKKNKNRWMSDKYKTNPDYHNRAIRAGHLHKWSTWIFNDAQIFLFLGGDGMQTQLRIDYYNLSLRNQKKAYDAKQKRLKEEAEMKKLETDF